MTMEIEEKLVEVLGRIEKTLSERKFEPVEQGFLTTKTLAKRWSVSETTVKELKAADAIPYIFIKGNLRFPIKDIELWEKKHTNRAS